MLAGRPASAVVQRKLRSPPRRVKPNGDRSHPEPPGVAQYSRTALTGTFPRRPRPPSAWSSIRNEYPTTWAPSSARRRPVAAAVPPVAKTSSTTNTRASPAQASAWISKAPEPYSRAYSVLRRWYGSFPGFRTGTNPDSRPSATGDPRMNPRLSMATTCVTPSPRNGSVMACTVALKSPASPNNGVMSLNRIPGRGKSGTSRTARPKSCSSSGTTVTRSPQDREGRIELGASVRSAHAHFVYARACGTAPDRVQQERDPLLRPGRLQLDAAVRQVAHPAGQLRPARCLPHEP